MLNNCRHDTIPSPAPNFQLSLLFWQNGHHHQIVTEQRSAQSPNGHLPPVYLGQLRNTAVPGKTELDVL